jgi:hypothetical protein
VVRSPGKQSLPQHGNSSQRPGPIGLLVEAGLSRAEREAIASGLDEVPGNLDRFAATASGANGA